MTGILLIISLLLIIIFINVNSFKQQTRLITSNYIVTKINSNNNNNKYSNNNMILYDVNNLGEKEEDLDETTKKYGFEVGMFKAMTSKDKNGETKVYGGK